MNASATNEAVLVRVRFRSSRIKETFTDWERGIFVHWCFRGRIKVDCIFGDSDSHCYIDRIKDSEIKFLR